jgi:hypothetical protein
MTILRKVAVRVSEFTVLHASAGSREWAEGLAREVEFVEGDWAALGWALGSLRSLIDRRIGSLEEVPKVARRMARGTRGEELMVWCSVLNILAAALPVLDRTQPLDRAGAALRMLGWICILIISYRNRQSSKLVEAQAGDWRLFEPDDTGTWVLFYKAELERRLENQRWPRTRVVIAALLCMGGSWILTGPHSPFLEAMLGAVLVSLGLFSVYTHRRMHRRLRRLDELLAESEDAC